MYIRCGFLQGDSCSSVGHCLTEVPVTMLLKERRGDRCCCPRERTPKGTHSLFIDDLKSYRKAISKWNLHGVKPNSLDCMEERV